jgi:serine/threonine protein kinase
MTPERWQRICAVFERVRQADPAGRDALLHEACSDDPDLRTEVERLLADDRAASRDGFLDVPTASVAPAEPILERPGDHVGPYKFLQALGEGGMGLVFLAEQDRPVRRRVALKLIKPGMDSAQVIARFAAERQALALMDHPNIARVLDAGATDAGRPFFVMELVKGVPITDYCDRNRLTPHQRLDLFIPVCRAIQHAHQKGIIHRDIKPSNVLVALVDGRPVPKVIDFGVAKAIDQRLTERTIFTQLGAIVGTPEYMSPEQAGLWALDVDTRSDVYSLGVLLYELLTGSTPLERERLRGAAYGEIARRILEEEPPRPSTRLSGSGDRLEAIAARRGVEAGRLAKLVRGELDWIAMRCLEKDPSRRYDTAGSLARDVERYLAGEAVEAGPPSAWYQLGKLARRHRAALAVAAAFAALLIVGAATSAYLAMRAMRAEAEASQALEQLRQKAKTDAALAEARVAKAKIDAELKESEESRSQAEAVSRFLVEALLRPDKREDGKTVTVAQLVDRAAAKLDDRFAGGPQTRGVLLDLLGRTYRDLGLDEKAVQAYERAVAVRREALGPEHPETMVSLTNLADLRREVDDDNRMIGLARAYLAAGRRDEAIPLLERTLKLREATLGRGHPDTIATRANLGEVYLAERRAEEAIGSLEPALKLREATLGRDHSDTIKTRVELGEAYIEAGRSEEAIGVLEPALKLREATLGRDHNDTIKARNHLAVAYTEVGWAREAIELLQPALKFRDAKLGPDDIEAVRSLNILGYAYEAADRWAEAEPLRRAVVSHSRINTGILDLALGDALAALGENLVQLRKWAEAELVLRVCLDIRAKPLDDYWPLFVTMSYLGESLLGQRRYAEAEPLLLEGYDGLNRHRDQLGGRFSRFMTEAENRVVALYKAWGKPDRARAWELKLGLADLPDDVFAPPPGR